MLPQDQIWDFVSHQPNTNDDAEEILFFEDCVIPKGNCLQWCIRKFAVTYYVLSGCVFYF